MAASVERCFRAMGTDVHVIVVDGDAGHLEQAERAVAEREARWSRFRPDSELSAINANPGRPVVVSADTYALVAAAVDAHSLTRGAFDPTVLSCLLAAGYDAPFDTLDPDRHVQDEPNLRPAPTPAEVELLPGMNAVQVPRGVGLDLGGIAKGATADAVVAELLAAGAGGCCVNIGGDLRAGGRWPDGGWVIELDCRGAPTTRVIRLDAGAVCTSTTRKRIWAHHRLGPQHHLRQPATGHPVRSGLCSVTVLGARATQAEVLTKAALAAGPGGAAAVLAASGATGLVVTDDGTVIELDGLDRFLVGASR